MEKYGFPNVSDFLQLERETFSCLHNAAWVGYHPSFYAAVVSTYAKFDSSTCINFEGEFVSHIEGEDRSVYVGSLVETANDSINNISFYCAIMESVTSTVVLRKLHFDVAIPGQKNKEKHPLYHFQIGGKPSRLLRDKGADMTHVMDWLSLPRFPHYPFSTALFLDIIFREVGDDHLKKFIGGGSWRDLIKTNEKKIWLPFFDLATSVLQSRSNNLMDKFYEP